MCLTQYCSDRRLSEHDYLLIGAPSSGACAHQGNLGKVESSNPAVARAALASDDLEASTREFPVDVTCSQQEHAAVDSESGFWQGSNHCKTHHSAPCELAAEMPVANQAAVAAATAVDALLFPDPGINGKSTHAWVSQFFAQSRLHYIGSWQQRSIFPRAFQHSTLFKNVFLTKCYHYPFQSSI